VQGGLTSPNLTVAEHLLDFDRRWNAAIENSAPDRVSRIDQKNERKGTAHQERRLLSACPALTKNTRWIQ